MNGVLRYLPQRLTDELGARLLGAEELRLRVDEPSSVYCAGRERLLTFRPNSEEIELIVRCLSKHSLYSYMEELKQGFFSIEGGVRVGVGGRAVCEDGKITHFCDFTSVNLRFPREVKGIGRAVLPFITRRRGVLSTLIISPPQMGKTTLLRDIIRLISDDGVKCTLVDERCELYAAGGFDVGMRTDVLRACPKAVGMNMALRSLSPQVIATDEIGGSGELCAICDAANAGVKVIATAHGGSIDELLKRSFFKELMYTGTVERYVLLSESLGRGTVERIFDDKLEPVCNMPFLPKEVSEIEVLSDRIDSPDERTFGKHVHSA